ncbi:hypothetical protein [Corallococcus sp. AS-1-6]|uniref:hypothetical protein n=1 Tax=Corallococcus sp. AS-1-6 TaxID=2874599 RepID=UPI001CBB7A6A|nr:hypothetical protein [Corallococcus sp. AS-1-6]MBZ4376457.1 hypothetical protein [Corallococcus sp. AS-1-6]
MGWLEEFVKETKGIGKVSWAKVSRDLRREPSWKGLRISEGSLATYLGAFDQGKNLHLLGTNPRLRALLVEYLQVAEEDFQERLESLQRTRPSQQHSFRLWDANTRPLNLGQESLPAAFPDEVLDTRSWAGSPILWRARNGSGRTLVGEWLEAQGKALFIRAESWNEARRKLPRTGRAFIELKSPMGLLGVDTRPSGIDLCVAVDGLPDDAHPDSPFQEAPQEESRPSNIWTIVSSPAVEEWLESLVFWIEERRADEEAFDPRSCLDWLRKDILPLGLIDGFETAVGFVGVYAEFRRQLQSKKTTTQVDLARYFLRIRGRHIPERDTSLDIASLWTFLSGMAHRLLVHGEEPWFQARPLDEWRTIVRDGPAASDVIDWLSDASVQKLLKLAPRDINKAVEALPPQAFQRVKTLQQLFLLREQQPGLYALRPSWVFETVLGQSADALLQEEAETWGEALLHAHGANFVFDKLLFRCQGGDFDPIRRLLAHQDRRSPAWTAALESSFVALGLTLLEGGGTPEALHVEVFDLQQSLTSELNGIPLPRTFRRDGLQSPLLSHGYWILAAHALTEERSPSRAAAHPVLDPWNHAFPANVHLNELILSWQEIIERPHSEEIKLRVIELYGRLLRRRSTPPSQLLHFQIPEFLLTVYQSNELNLQHVKILSKLKGLVQIIRPYFQRRGQEWESFARALWRVWLDSSEELPRALQPGPRSADLWSLIPAEAMQDERLSNWLSGTSVPFELFRDDQWVAFLRYWPRRMHPGFDLDPGYPWQAMPESFMRRALLDEVLREGHQDHEARRAIWKKAPSVARDGLRDYVQRGKWTSALGLARAAPAEETPSVIAMIRKGITQPDVPNEAFISWLHHLINLRVPGWKEAWALRCDIEEGAKDS